MKFLDVFRCMKISIQISLRCVLTVKPTFVQINIRRRIGDNSLSELMMASCTDAYRRHPAMMSQGQTVRKRQDYLEGKTSTGLLVKINHYLRSENEQKHSR